MIKAGVVGFKCFLIHSGVDEFPHVTDSDLHAALEHLKGTGTVLLVSPLLSNCVEIYFAIEYLVLMNYTHASLTIYSL